MTISLGFWLVSTVATAVLSAVAACCAMRWLGAARPSSAADAHPPGHRPCAASLTFAPVAFCSAPSAPKADAGSTVQLLLAQLAARGDLLGLRWLTSLGDQLSGWPAPQYTAQLSTPMSSLPAASPPATCAEFAREQQPGCPEKIPPSSTGSKSADGELVLVGAGPGHVSLLTLAALAAIAEADLVVADRLIPAETLRLCRGQLVVAQKEYGRAHVAQEEIHAACLKGLQRGWRVVRLKGGDPFVFGRGGEELLHFRQLGYRVRVVPGISSSLSAPLLAGIPVTHRGIADQILVATAHGKDDSGKRDGGTGAFGAALMDISKGTIYTLGFSPFNSAAK